MLKYEDKYVLGIEEIDQEHRELIERTNQLMDSYQSGNTEIEIIRLLDFLSEYVVVHFQNEEAYLLKKHYPYYDDHFKLHQDFKAAVIALKTNIEANGLTLSTRLELTHIATEWLTRHIGVDDRAWATYLYDLNLV